MHTLRTQKGKLLIVALLALLLAVVATFGAAPAHAATLSARSSITGSAVHISQITREGLRDIPLAPTCTATDNQTIYQWYSSIKGSIPLRVGYQDTVNNRGYGYCHIQYKHPDALDKIQYILTYGHVVATSPTSFTVRGTWPTGQQYQIYIVTSNNNMKDGLMRGIVSAYPYPGGD